MLTGCQSEDNSDIRKYYFAEGDINKTRLYIYKPVGAPSDAPADYWLQTLTKNDSGLYLRTVYYDRNKDRRQSATERITPTGSLQKVLQIFEKDSVGQLRESQAAIMSGAIFPFHVKDTNTMVIYEVKYPLPGAAHQVVVRRNRRYGGPGPAFTLHGKTYATIKMLLSEKIIAEGEGSATIQGFGEEWYAAGLGRVYYSKSYGDGILSETFELVDVRDCPSAEPCF